MTLIEKNESLDIVDRLYCLSSVVDGSCLKIYKELIKKLTTIIENVEVKKNEDQS